MDNAVGWSTMRRAKEEKKHYLHPQRGSDGRFTPVEQVTPMDEYFIGGFHPHSGRPTSVAPPLPPKDRIYSAPPFYGKPQNTVSPAELTRLTAVERSRLMRVARMEPHLQFMVGPLLRFDTIDADGVWHGAALIVTSDSNSTYEPHPTLTYEWDPDAPAPKRRFDKGHGSKPSYDLGPHPADPSASVIPMENANGAPFHGPNYHTENTPGQEIWAYAGNGGTFTFWRFRIRVPLGQDEMPISYSINKGQKLHFFVPGRTQNMRWAAHSCNGFSAGVNQDDFRGPGFATGYDPCWTDLLAKHTENPFHVLVGGGDQLYCDGLTREPELQEWVSKTKPEDRKSYQLTDEILEAIDRFYFNHYCQSFRSGAFARANSSIPMMNMCDDHDLIDGFGSYPDDLQSAPIFKTIGSRGYWFFLLFQCFINPELDGLDDAPNKHWTKSLVIGQQGPFIPQPSHSLIASLGPKVWMLLLDCRAERKKDRVCSELQYQKVFDRLDAIPAGVEQLVIQLGIPIAYPRMVFLETFLESKMNPFVALGKSGSMGLSSFVNKFNADAELLDDLNDHWTASGHKRERNWFITKLAQFAKTKKIRISFVSGDVHCAAVGNFKTLKVKGQEVEPAQDHRYMLNIVTSAIVNTPPPPGVISMVSSLASKTHKTLHHEQIDETMVPLFAKDTDGSSRKAKFIMGRRNWCSADWDETTGDLVYEIRVEKEKGLGETVGYSVRSPAPQWDTV
ncbi:hypothetical protein CYLTODRAFT_76394 [Cylindrobasidium torrendii FP15055 ss-10]|uniref:PhoD-like phosphatase domain-containing protein n=1 Tax=Cylindrobasidium torrendii FP15055 ss-10 TaxID=1314674 RepID=A0A0D7B3F4_9AGAR|nr:hypothetical protein CYLTODRAFT_76394 [Cylindrobasidium torrendii FP15055 ss-10]